MGQTDYPGFQISEDMKFQKREWLLQRIAWIVLYGLLLAILLGLLGKGMLSHASAELAAGAAQMTYERFMRYKASDTLRFTIHPTSSMIRIHLDSGYFDKVELEKATPQPHQVISAGGRLTFVFRTEPGDKLQIAFDIKPERPGKVEGWFAVDEHPHKSFSQFVYP